MRAEPWLRRALTACQQAGDRRNEMRVLNSLGAVALSRGQSEVALAWFDRCLELGRGVRVIERLPLAPDEYRGQRCPEEAVLVALTGERPCARLSVDDGLGAWAHAVSPHTVPSELLGWPDPAVAACANETVATSFDRGDPALLRCEAPNDLLVSERRIRP